MLLLLLLLLLQLLLFVVVLSVLLVLVVSPWALHSDKLLNRTGAASGCTTR